MKITAFSGSPRGSMSVTDRIVREFLAGAQAGGASVANILLTKKQIDHCTGCLSCWTDTPGECVIHDDMKGLIADYLASDVAVFASPVYFDNVTGIMKDFIDRLIPTADPHLEKDEGGECAHAPLGAKAPKIVVISNCGFPERSHFQVIQLYFKRLARNSRTQVIAEIYRGAGWAIQHPVFLKLGLVDEYLKVVRQAGFEIVQAGRLSEETSRRLEQPLLPDEECIRIVNRWFDDQIERSKLRRTAVAPPP